MMHTEYKNEAIRELRDQLVRFAPREKKIEQIDRAEKLLREIDAKRTYNYEYVCFRVTSHRPQNAPVISISADDVRHDLHCLIEDLSESADIRIEDVGQPVHTVEDLSKMFNVSTKTIARWRQHGLVSRRLIFDGGRKRVGFLQNSVDQFVKSNRLRVLRGERFSQLSDQDRDDIIERARRLVQAGGCPAEVTRRIAEHMNRSVETIRYTIKQFDERNPAIAVFPDQTGPLNLEMKERIYADFMSGKSADSIAKRYCRTKGTIYRVVNEMRANSITAAPTSGFWNRKCRNPNCGNEKSDPPVACRDIWLHSTKSRCSPANKNTTCSAR
jgi:RNA polymerase primary sigma factor